MPGNRPDFLKILVVDDILYVVKSIGRVLSGEGYFVLTSRTGREALQKFKEYSPDLVTIDQKLPDMTGKQLVQMIRKIDTTGKARIIFISAVDDKQEIQSILQQGIDDYLVKPFKKNRLIETVKSLIGSARATSDEVGDEDEVIDEIELSESDAAIAEWQALADTNVDEDAVEAAGATSSETEDEHADSFADEMASAGEAGTGVDPDADTGGGTGAGTGEDAEANLSTDIDTEDQGNSDPADSSDLP